MVSRHALVDDDGVVDNVVVWDGETEWTPPDGLTLVDLDEASLVQPGDLIDAKGNVVGRADADLDSVDDARAKVAKVTNVATRDALTAVLDALDAR